MPASRPPTRPTPPAAPNGATAPAAATGRRFGRGAKPGATAAGASAKTSAGRAGGPAPRTGTGAGAGTGAKASTGVTRAAARTAAAGGGAVQPAAAVKKGRLEKMRGTLGQLGEVLKITYSTDRRLPLWLLAAFLPLPILGFVIGHFVIQGTGSTIYYTVIGAFLGLLAALIIFGRRAETAAYARLGDSPGAAAAAIGTLKKNWTVEPGIGGTRTLEVVHRAVGRPGIVLVGEGPSDNRLKDLLASEVRRHQRVAPDTPIRTMMAGATPGRVPVRGLPRRLGKLPTVLSGSDVSELNRRLKALGIGAPKMPAGPLPKGVKLPKGLRPPPETGTGSKKT